MNIFMWEWPQYVYFSFMIIGLVFGNIQGAFIENKVQSIGHIIGVFLSSILGFWVLYMGGFWS